MAHRALVEILADSGGYVKGLAVATRETKAFEGNLKTLTVNVKASADAQVAASVKKTARLREEAAAYHALASTAKRGSSEQVAAANLADRADRRLAGSLGVAAHEARRLRASSGGIERDLGRASRGALAGSGIFRGLGRSIAFASGGFLAFASAGQFLRSSVDAAREAGVTQKQLVAQLKASGVAFADYRKQIDATNLRLSALSGITKDDLDRAFTTIFRGTNNVNLALKDTALAANIAAGTHKNLATVSLAVGKAAAGNATALKRLGIALPKGATGLEALALAAQRFKGQAAAGATEAKKFGSELHNSEVIIGEGILPVLNKYLASGAKWLSQMNESGKLQRDVSGAAKDFGKAMHAAGAVVGTVKGVIEGIDDVTGGFKQTLKAVAGVMLLLKARSVLLGDGLLGLGSKATVAEGEVAGLRGALLSLKTMGLITVGVEVAIHRKQVAGFIGDKVRDVTGSNLLGHAARVAEQGAIDIATGGALAGYDIADYFMGKKKPKPKPKPSGNGVSVTVQPDTGKPFGQGRGDSPPSPPPKPTKRPLSLQGQFNLSEYRLAQAQLTKRQSDDLKILQTEARITREQIRQAKSLKDKTRLTQQLAGILSQIRGIEEQAAAAEKARAEAAKRRRDEAAAKRRARADRIAAGGVPMALQLAQAKADAIAAGTGATDMTPQQIKVAKEIRAAEYKAIRSHKLSMQGLIDAWNEIAAINQQLASQAGSKGSIDTYHAVSTRALTAGMGLSRDQRLRLEERMAQRAAHRGYVPSGPAALGQGITFTGPVTITGVQNIDQLEKELRKKAKQRAASRTAGRR